MKIKELAAEIHFVLVLVACLPFMVLILFDDFVFDGYFTSFFLGGI